MKRVVIFVLVAVFAMSGLARLVSAQNKDDDIDPRILAYDKGPAKIDVSKYPPEMQSAYKVFTSKCSKCHTVARAINCEFALDDEWERYVKRMMNKGGSLISATEGKQIFEFLSYDSKTRKKALYDKKTKEAANATRPVGQN